MTIATTSAAPWIADAAHLGRVPCRDGGGLGQRIGQMGDRRGKDLADPAASQNGYPEHRFSPFRGSRASR
jgi:hypothetical protein